MCIWKQHVLLLQVKVPVLFTFVDFVYVYRYCLHFCLRVRESKVTLLIFALFAFLGKGSVSFIKMTMKLYAHRLVKTPSVWIVPLVGWETTPPTSLFDALGFASLPGQYQGGRCFFVIYLKPASPFTICAWWFCFIHNGVRFYLSANLSTSSSNRWIKLFGITDKK